VCGALTSPRLDRGTTFVAADSGSTYEPYPTLKYRWDPKKPASYHKYLGAQGGDLGPHPADPMAQHYRRQDDGHIEGPNVLERRVLGTELHVYGGRGGYVCILQLSRHAESPHSMPLAHARFGGSSFRFRCPIPR
jgi:hypothetical protein